MTRIGLIGCGRWGRNAARAIASEATLAWMCDVDTAARMALAETYDVPSTDTPWWQACDAVWIATPIGTHEALAHEALSRGKHVLCEKPLALTKAAAAGLAEHARVAGRVLMADHTWLAHAGLRPRLDHARAARCTGYQATRHAYDERGFDALEDMLPHDTVLARHAFKRDVVRVCVPAAERRVLLDFGGHTAQASYRYDVRAKVREVAVHAADASFAADHGELPEGAPEPLRVIVREFCDAIAGGREPSIGGAAEFVHVGAVIEAAKQSRASGGVWVDVDR
jgi:predicted dehydrogenase